MTQTTVQKQTTVQELLLARAAASRQALLATLSVILGSLVILASSRLQLPIPGSAVPVTLQTIVVLLLGMALGPRLGAAAAALYFVECLAVPGFSATGRIALTGGYVLGFIPAAWLAGALFRRGFGRSMTRALVAMVPANLVIFAFGVPWLALCTPLTFAQAVQSGFTVFLVAEAVKIALSAPMMRGVSAFSQQLENALRGDR